MSPVSLPIGRRNAGLFRSLCVAAGRDAGLRGDEARLAGLGQWLNSRLDEPLGGDEVRKLSAQAARYSGKWREHTPDFLAKQQARGRRSGEARRVQAEARNVEACRFRADGLNVSEIAKRLGVTRQTIYKALGRGD